MTRKCCANCEELSRTGICQAVGKTKPLEEHKHDCTTYFCREWKPMRYYDFSKMTRQEKRDALFGWRADESEVEP